MTDRRQKDAHIPTDIYEVSGGFNDLGEGRENHSRKRGGGKKKEGGRKARGEGEKSRKEVERQEGRGKNQGRK